MTTKTTSMYRAADGSLKTTTGPVPVGTVSVRSEPSTYSRESPYSFFVDLIAAELGRDGADQAKRRLERHGREMRLHIAKSDAEARRRLAAAGIEFRTEPNRTPGQGGNFAPPLWIVEEFATANRPGRPLADLVPNSFPLPLGVSSINVPILSTGTQVEEEQDNAGGTSQDIVDAPASSPVVMLQGTADVALQLLEQSPPGAHMDWAMYKDLGEAYDAQVETQLLVGQGSAWQQLLGITNVSGITPVTYTSGSPSGTTLWPLLGQLLAKVGDARQRPPEVWLMRTARLGWLLGAEDSALRPLGLPSPAFMGNTDDTPDPATGMFAIPVFLDGNIPATLGVANNQDLIIACRPSDLIFFEGTPRTQVAFAPGSGNLMARIQFRNYVAALTSRRPSGIGVLSGRGLAVASAY